MCNRVKRTSKLFQGELLIYLALALLLLLFVLYPVLKVILESVAQTERVWYGSYSDVLGGGELVVNSLLLAVMSTVGSVLLGLCVAVFVTRMQSRYAKTVLAAMFLANVSPPFVTALSYIMLVGKRGLITNTILGLVWNPYGMHGVVVMQVLGYASVAALLIIVTMKNISSRLEEASSDLGADSWQTFMRVTLPLAKKGIIAAGLIVFVKSLSDFGTPMIIGGNFRTLASEAYLSVIGQYDMPRAAAINVILLMPSLLVFYVYRKITADKVYTTAMAEKRQEDGVMMPMWLQGSIAAIVFLYIAFEILKYSMLFTGMFCMAWGADYTFTLSHIAGLEQGKWFSLWRSVEYSLLAAVLGSILSLAVSYFLTVRSYPCNGAVDLLSTLPYMLPGTFFGIGYLLAFNAEPWALTGTGSIIVLSCVFRQLPLGTKACTSSLSQINPLQESAARDLGASPFMVFWDIYLPQVKTALMISFANTFTATMTAVGAVIFLISPSSKVATVEMFSSIKTGNIGEGTVLANCIIFIVLLVNFLVYKVLVPKNVNRREKCR